ncbi:MAG: fumarate hydratase [Planctomycetota bacterium]
MRTVSFEQIVTAVESLCIHCAYELNKDVLTALQQAHHRESNLRAKKILAQLLENARLAERDRIPLCQDTGLAVVFVEPGSQVIVQPPDNNPSATIIDAINAGIASGYEKGYLRKSIVAEPLNHRKNTGSNTPAVIHITPVPGDKINITLMAKGGGCENKSRSEMFKPTADPDRILDWIIDVVKTAGADACPPFIVGVGLGGDFELCAILSKRALLRNIGLPSKDPFYAEMETKLLERINALGLGPQGLGGDTTALAVHIETAPCHIASLPVAVNIECHSHRHKSAII